MDPTGFTDAFLDSQYLRLDEGSLGFIFTPQRVRQAAQVPATELEPLLAANRAEMARLYGDVTRRILKDAFYDRLFEELAELPEDHATLFINLALRRIQDSDVEAARVSAVREYQARRKPAH